MAKFLCKNAVLMLKTIGATPTWKDVGQVEEIGAISITADEVEVTTLGAGDYREFLQGFKDPGECALAVVYDPGFADHDDSADGLWGIYSTGDVRDWAVKLESSSVGGFSYLIFQGFLRDWEFGAANVNDPQTIAPVIRLTGPITIDDVAPTVAANPMPPTPNVSNAAMPVAA